MKQLILILIFIRPIFLLMSQDIGGDYYVSPTGSDSNPGTYDQPWGTWQKAFEAAQPGDTVYFRDGVWKPINYTEGNAVTVIAPNKSFIWQGSIYGYDGTKTNPICFFNYPGENPILDCSEVDITGHQYNVGLSIYNADFIHFKGLTIRNVFQPSTPNSVGDYSPASGIGIVGTTNLIFENVTVSDIGGRGVGGSSLLGYHTDPGYDTTRFINVDVFNCNDALSEVPGNSADAYKITLQSYEVTEENNPNGVFPVYLLDGCRSWNCTDDGSDIGGNGIVIYRNCWFFSNGNENSIDGNGLKIGGVFDSINATIPLRIVTNCIMAHNKGIGIYDLQYEPYFQNNSRIYNNLLYGNGAGMQNGLANRYNKINSIYRNNIIYGSTDRDAAGRPQNFIVDNDYTESNNTFDFWEESGSLFKWTMATDVSVTDDDFVSLDVSQLRLPRKANGSLPDITFGHLTSNSDLIDKGTIIPETDNAGITLSYSGLAPDMGCFEFTSPQSIENLRNEEKFKLYYSNDEIYLKFIDGNVFYRYDLYSLNGFNVKSSLLYSDVCEINTSNMAAGIYLLVLTGENIKQNKKVFIH
ncbi:right-handed parallel beta-helix repeat-containing protein [Geofilum sp. OHC36d9]|uniref:right-handed parallel beta-helix repeat-containing protein n=1 Tax=Geofilum sp. OHC36d9 TaxID=3458413 RepID=UPI004034E11B